MDIDGKLVKLAADYARVGVWQLDVQKDNIIWSRTLFEIMGIPIDRQIKYESLPDFIHPDDQEFVHNSVTKSVENNEPYSIEYRVIRPDDGRTIWMNFTGQLIQDEKGEPKTLIGTGFDITHLKEAELRAESADRAKSEFLANMSHEIRTPMNGIMGVCDLLMQRDMRAEDQELLNIIQRSGTALLTIINDILDFSKIESGQMELNLEPFDLKDSMEDVTSLLATAKQENGVDVLVRYQPSLPSAFIGDGGRIRQIITNILGNALKFTLDGHVLVDVGGSTQDDVSTLTFRIQDTGIGIPEDKIDLIFDKFRQADGSTTRKFGGTGLGLTIAKSFIELMGGEMKVESEVGVGSTFSFTIDLPVNKNVKPKKARLHTQKNLNILVVDDSSVNRDILKEMLQHWGWPCVTAPSAKSGLSVLQKADEKNISIDLVILDYQMPDHDGSDFLKAMRKHSRFDDIPVLVLSSVDSSQLARKMKDMGAASFMTKPPRSSFLFDTITTIVHAPSLEDELGALEDLGAPMIESRPAHVPSEQSATSEKQDLSEIDILIAEDNEVNQMFVRHAMMELGYKFKVVGNGKLAIEKWKLLKPKAILMDISMPELNGYEATETIRDIEKSQGMKRTPIIAFTAHAMSGDKQDCFDKDMDDYITKPISLEKLKECLEQWIKA